MGTPCRSPVERNTAQFHLKVLPACYSHTDKHTQIRQPYLNLSFPAVCWVHMVQGEEVKKAMSYWCCSSSRKAGSWPCGGHGKGTERVRNVTQGSVLKWNAELWKSWGHNYTMYRNKTVRSELWGLCRNSIWTFQCIGRASVGQHRL